MTSCPKERPRSALKEGYRTIDIMSEGKPQIGTAGMGDLIASFIRR